MNSSRPYILRALHEWIVDNECTPHILVDADHPQVKVPPGHVVDGRIVLNTAPAAVRYLEIDSQAVSFEARFSGAPFSLYVPIDAVLAIYARENGKGMFFDTSADAFDEDEEVLAEDNAEIEEQPTVLHAVDTDSSADSDNPDDEPPRPPSPGRPSLRIIK